VRNSIKFETSANFDRFKAVFVVDSVVVHGPDIHCHAVNFNCSSGCYSIGVYAYNGRPQLRL
jgi:hypothetical protein